MMREENTGKIGLLLTLGCVFGVVALIPYAMHLQEPLLREIDLPIPLGFLLIISVIQNTILFAFIAFIGLYLADRTGFELPIMEKLVSRKPWRADFQDLIPLSASVGVVSAVVIVFLDYFVFMALSGFSSTSEALQAGVIHPEWWMGLLASLYGGINEEVFSRLFLISLIVFLSQKMLRRKTDEPTGGVVWFAIIVSAILFGLSHLPATLSAGVPITCLVVVRAVILNSVGAIPFGWLFWRKGLASAMAAHFSADIVLHVILPLFY